MTLRNFAVAGLLAASTLVVGCDKEPAATPAPTATDTNMKANAAAADIKTQAAAAQQQTAIAVDNANATGKSMAADATTQTADATSAMTAQVQKLYDNAKSAVSAGKFDDAQKYVDQLKALRDKLPADWQAKIDDLSKMLTDAKAKLGNLPSMPGGLGK